MLYKQKNFIQRSLSIALFLPLVLIALIWSQWTYFCLCFYILLLSMLEFYKPFERIQIHAIRSYGTLLGLSLYTLSFAYACQNSLSVVWLFGLVPSTILTVIIAIHRPKTPNPFLDVVITIFALLYISIPLSCLHYLAFFTGSYSHKLILGLLLMIWSQDLGGYIVGTLFGKSKMCPNISPKKTWEGFVGGVVFIVLVSHILACNLPILEPWQWYAIMLVTIITGSYGDLLASLMKRNVNIKNFSELIPGHGGILDRIDSLLLTIPAVSVFLKICSIFA